MNADEAVTAIFGFFLGVVIAVACCALAWPTERMKDLETLTTQRVVCPMCEGAGVVPLPKVKDGE